MAAAPVFTIRNAMIACGLDNHAIFAGEMQAQRFATKVFDNNFTSCMDKIFNELEDNFKSYAALTVANGQIRLTPGTKRNVNAFIQWTIDRYCLGKNLTDMAYPVADSADQMRRYKHHYAFINKSKTLIDTAMPE